MTTQELIDILQSMIDSGDIEPTTPVRKTYNYGDYWNTKVADEVEESDVETGYVEYSSYHKTNKVVDDYDDDSEFCVLL